MFTDKYDMQVYVNAASYLCL